MKAKTLPISRMERSARLLAAACAAALLAALGLALQGAAPVEAQQADVCAPIDLGMLGESGQGALEAEGRWTTSDCDSGFRTDSDAHTYRFEVTEGGRVRIDLISAEGDSFLYLLTEDGRRLADNDDGGAGLDARIERDLAPGLYIVEATTVGGRSRGPADFRLSISRVMGCEPVHLGSLTPGIDLTASGSWTLDTCGSRFVVEHPAHSYLFHLPQGSHVRIDLTSENGDPVLSLVSVSTGLLAANDDGGEQRNSRIERYLEPGVYLLEATTYLERDYQPLMADFTLVVHLVDEKASQDGFLLKIEEVYTPEHVIAGQPFPVHYRVGNLGRGSLADVGGNAVVYVVGPRVFERTAAIAASETRWQAGVSYHTGASTADSASVSIGEIAPFEVTLGDHGPSWVFVAVITHDDDGEERGFHGLWHNLTVLSGTAFDAVTVSVDGTDYLVEAQADAEGVVTTSVTAAADPEAEVDDETRAKAVYAAGVRTQFLEDILQRPALAGLPTDAQPAAVSIVSPSSGAMLRLLGGEYADALAAPSLPASLARGEAVNPVAVEDLLLGMGETAKVRYAALAASWSGLQERVDGGAALSFAEARALHAQLAYAERIIAPLAAAGDAVSAARGAEDGWDDAAVQQMLGTLTEQGSCFGAGGSLRT
ncbi:MAG: PPC domain-containing protein, partial [Chloroflexota bacterium]|nr:PPC domain-containing protein [Chloroflexota bacterium]